MCVWCFPVFVTFPNGVLGQVWYLIVSIPDICLHPHFNRNHKLSVNWLAGPSVMFGMGTLCCELLLETAMQQIGT